MKSETFIEILNPEAVARLGHIRYALFDFDGTLSTLRQGWEASMAPVMLEAIHGEPPYPPELVLEVQEYIDRSTGILTIHQMEWLAEAVQRGGRMRPVRTPAAYKAIYLQRLMTFVQQRIDQVTGGQAAAADYLLAGSQAFVQALVRCGVQLYLASGTDHADVFHEASVLGMAPYFQGGIYGALDASEANDKGRLIGRLLTEHGLAGEQLLVVGDGPVEIRAGQQHGALTLGVASDEVRRRGWNDHKVKRLAQAGCDFLVPDFGRTADLVNFLALHPGDQLPDAQGRQQAD